MVEEKEVLRVSDLEKRFRTPEHSITVFSKIGFTLSPGSSLAVTGPSGSGKSTLLALCAGLEQPTEGVVHLCGTDLTHTSEEERAALRLQFTGFVFQAFQLLPSLSALENVLVPLELRGQRRSAAIARDLLTTVGLASRLHHLPHQLSGGEQQRVAVARAFANQPKILFADEPTGNLDRAHADQIAELLFSLVKDHDSALMLVTHNPELAARCDAELHLDRGTLQ